MFPLYLSPCHITRGREGSASFSFIYNTSLPFLSTVFEMDHRLSSICRDTLISPACAITHASTSKIFLQRATRLEYFFLSSRVRTEAFKLRHEGFLYERHDADGGCGMAGGRHNPRVERAFPLPDLRAGLSPGGGWWGVRDANVLEPALNLCRCMPTIF